MRGARWIWRRQIALFLLALAYPQAARLTAAEYDLRALSGPRADVAALILGGRESGALRVAALAVAGCVRPSSTSEPSSAEIRIGVEIEASSLLDAVASIDQSDVPQSVRVELYAYVMTRAGEIAASLSRWVRLPLTDLASRSPGGGVKLVDHIDLPPGEYQVRVLVRDARSQQFALRVLGVEISGGSDSKPSITQPAFLPSEDAWLIATGDAQAPEFPSALPVLVPSEPRTFTVPGCDLADTALGARLLTRDRQPVDGVRIRLEAPAGTPAGPGVGTVAIGDIQIEEMEPGLYVLEVAATSSTGRITRELPVFVIRDTGVSTWAGLGGLTDQPETPEEDFELAESAGSSKKIRAIEVGYRRVLGTLASGRLGPAIAALEELEEHVLAAHDKPRKALKWLTEAQNRVTRQILGHDPECLLPVLMLHLDLQRQYVKAGDASTHLLHATRTRIRSLAQIYATDAKQEMAPALAAMSLAELATVLEKSGHLISALIVLREALTLDHSNTDVILDLAYQYEHHQFRQETLDLLRRLVELEPHSDEGRLRLAINLFHFERSDEAVALLRQLIANGSTEWVLAVAYQELGHHLLRRQRFEDAARLLEEAVRRLPNVQRLRIELAYALDRTGQRQRGRSIVSGLPPDSGRSSPRLLYRVPDRSVKSRSRADLLRHGTARLPLLAAALAKSGGLE